MPRSLGDNPPQGIRRAFARFPLWFYRLRLGFLFGERFLMLTHTGRKSGLQRETVVEVVRHDTLTDSYVIASGWGEKSNWFRNVLQNPRVMIAVGFRRMLPAQAVRLSEQGAKAEFQDYARRHPRAFRMLASRILGHPTGDAEVDSRLLARNIPIVVLQTLGQQ
jgi:deazaflavin-dependent oxidoreductase (nitroreductase family)